MARGRHYVQSLNSQGYHMRGTDGRTFQEKKAKRDEKVRPTSSNDVMRSRKKGSRSVCLSNSTWDIELRKESGPDFSSCTSFHLEAFVQQQQKSSFLKQGGKVRSDFFPLKSGLCPLCANQCMFVLFSKVSLALFFSKKGIGNFFAPSLVSLNHRTRT